MINSSEFFSLMQDALMKKSENRREYLCSFNLFWFIPHKYLRKSALESLNKPYLDTALASIR